MQNGFQVYGLFLHESTTPQGLIALRPSPDHGAFVLDIVESAPHNVGKTGQYDWVGENLFAFAGKLSFDLHFEGYLFLTAKSDLMDYYSGLGARLLRNRDFVFPTLPDRKLIDQYLGGDDLVECK